MKHGPVAVVIGTTEGPSEVLRIAVEAPEIRSVVCLGMSTEALPISPAYDAFVRRPTGVVERELGHAAYRVDVSARIDNGNSWQLGFYLAHRLMAAGRLATPEEAPEHWIWVTGTLNSDLVIGPVVETERKLRQSEDWFARRAEAGATVTVVAPAQSSEALEVLPSHVKSLAGADLGPVLDFLGLEASRAAPLASDTTTRKPDISEETPRPPASGSRMGGLLVVLLLAVGAAVAVWLIQPQWVDRAFEVARGMVGGASTPVSQEATAPPEPRAEATEERPPIGGAPGGEPSKQAAAAKALVETATAAPIPRVEIAWELGKPAVGQRCGGELTFTPRSAEAGVDDTPTCRVAAVVTNQSTAQTPVLVIAGILGRLREYTRADRYVKQLRRVLKPGASARLVLDLPSWVRGSLSVKALVQIEDASTTLPAELSSEEALEMIGSSTTPSVAASSTITLE